MKALFWTLLKLMGQVNSADRQSEGLYGEWEGTLFNHYQGFNPINQSSHLTIRCNAVNRKWELQTIYEKHKRQNKWEEAYHELEYQLLVHDMMQKRVFRQI